MTEREAQAAVAEQLARAGDCVADMFGYAVAAMEAEEPFTDMEVALARTAILGWRRARALGDGLWRS